MTKKLKSETLAHLALDKWDPSTHGEPIHERVSRLIQNHRDYCQTINLNVPEKYRAASIDNSMFRMRDRIADLEHYEELIQADKGKSTALRFMTLAWQHGQEDIGHSWQRMNHALSNALMTAISLGLHFDPDDFKTIFDSFRGGYWFGDSERFYSRAVEYRHQSACVSFETWKGRRPYIWEGERIYVGREIIWNGDKCTVTSIDPDKFVACKYKGWAGDPTDSDTRYDRTPAKVYKITHADLKAARKAAKEAGKAKEQVAAG